jgi:hypothetical protein
MQFDRRWRVSSLTSGSIERAVVYQFCTSSYNLLSVPASKGIGYTICKPEAFEAITLDNGVTLTIAAVFDDSARAVQLIVTSASGSFDLSVSVVGGAGAHAKGDVLRSVAALKGSYGG